MTSPGTPLSAAVVLTVFGFAGGWILSKRFPTARLMRIGYFVLGTGGVLFVAWALTRVWFVGLAGATVMAAGCIVGIIGAFRKELRTIL